MKPTYRIKDWDKHFENHESRKVKRSYWVAVPNRHDGKSYRRIAAHPEGVQVFAAWILILEAASKMPERGVLADEDGPLDAEDLSAMTGFPSSIFDAAFNLLTQERFGWLSTGEARTKKQQSPGTSRHFPLSPGVTGNAAVEQNRMEPQGTIGNGTEGNDMEQRPRSARGNARGTRLPDDFSLNSKQREWAALKAPLVDLETALAEFVDYWRAVPGAKGRKLDWDATFRNRLRELQGRALSRNGGRPGVGNSGLDAARRVAAKYEQRS